MVPSMVLAERNIARVVKDNVRANPKCPLGGQQGFLLSSWVSFDPSARYTTVGKDCVEGGGLGLPPSGEKGGLNGFGSSLKILLFVSFSDPWDLQVHPSISKIFFQLRLFEYISIEYP